MNREEQEEEKEEEEDEKEEEADEKEEDEQGKEEDEQREKEDGDEEKEKEEEGEEEEGGVATKDIHTVNTPSGGGIFCVGRSSKLLTKNTPPPNIKSTAGQHCSYCGKDFKNINFQRVHVQIHTDTSGHHC